MSAPFADAQARLTQTVIAHLADATATLGGVTVQCMFDAAYAQVNVGLHGVASSAPMLHLKTADVPADVLGVAVTVNGAAYTVAEHQPDGAGISRLLLAAA